MNRRGDIIPEGFEVAQLSNFDKNQKNVYKNQFQHLSPDSYLSKLAGGDQALYDELEAPAIKQFGQFQGNTASRFSGMGLGARNSSGFQNTLNQGASDFAQQLQSQRMNMRNQALRELMGFSNQILGQRPYDRFLAESQPEDQGIDWMGLGGAALGGVGGFFAGGGNPMTAIQGASLGYNIGSGLGGRGGSGGGGGGSSYNFGQMAQNLRGSGGQITPGGIGSGSSFNPGMF
jgi:hypothetical protein